MSADDKLLTLDQAAKLPRLGGHFSPRTLYRAAAAHRLRTSRPTGRALYTTPAWVAAWVEGASPEGGPGPDGKRQRGPAATASAASASVTARLAALKRSRG